MVIGEFFVYPGKLSFCKFTFKQIEPPMAYDEHLAERIRQSLTRHKTPFEEKKMMGGLCFMVDDKMCLGVMKNELMARIDPEIVPEALKRKEAHPMDFTGKRMKSFATVKPEGVDLETDFEYWIQLCLDFNPKAKSSKKKK